MKKEILTRDKFSIGFAKSKTKELIIDNFFAFGFIWVLFWMISVMLNFPIIHIIVGIGLITIYFALLIDFIVKLNRLKKGNYVILKDEVIGTSHRSFLERTFDYYVLGVWFLLSRAPHNLNFKCYGIYTIPSGENYAWSKMHNMKDKSVFNSTNIGDEFYLVSFDNKRISLAYNAKLFEFKE